MGRTYRVANTSSTTCSMHGYPGLAMLDAQGEPLPTHVRWGSSTTVPPEPVSTVVLGPGDEAWFLLGYAQSTGYGTAQCPRSAALEITPPNDYTSVTVTGQAGQIDPYGGSASDPRCGTVTVSPMLANRPA